MRAIDGDELLGIERLLDTDVVRQSKTASWLLDQIGRASCRERV